MAACYDRTVDGEPIGAFVVDLDPKDSTTAGMLLEDLRKAVGGRLPPCPMVRTPRGGLHLYFAIPAGVEIGNRANQLKAPKGAAMIDVRGTGGYVAVPPSSLSFGFPRDGLTRWKVEGIGVQQEPWKNSL